MSKPVANERPTRAGVVSLIRGLRDRYRSYQTDQIAQLQNEANDLYERLLKAPAYVKLKAKLERVRGEYQARKEDWREEIAKVERLYQLEARPKA